MEKISHTCPEPDTIRITAEVKLEDVGPSGTAGLVVDLMTPLTTPDENATPINSSKLIHDEGDTRGEPHKVVQRKVVRYNITDPENYDQYRTTTVTMPRPANASGIVVSLFLGKSQNLRAESWAPITAESCT